MIKGLLRPNGFSETALILVALKSFLRLYPHEPHSHRVSHFSYFLNIMKGMHRSNALATLDHMSGSLWLLLSD